MTMSQSAEHPSRAHDATTAAMPHQKKKGMGATHMMVAAATLLVGIMALTPLYTYRNLVRDDTAGKPRAALSPPHDAKALDHGNDDLASSLRAIGSLTTGLPLSHLRSLPPQQLHSIRAMLQAHLSTLAEKFAIATASDRALKKAAAALHVDPQTAATADGGGQTVVGAVRSVGEKATAVMKRSSSGTIVADIAMRRLMEFADTMVVPNNGWTRLRDPRGDTGMPRRVVVNHTSRTATDDASRVEGTMQNMRCALQLMSRSTGAHLGEGRCTLYHPGPPSSEQPVSHRFMPIGRIRRHLKGCIGALFASEAFVEDVVLGAATPIVDVCTLYDAMVQRSRPLAPAPVVHPPQGFATAAARAEFFEKRAHAAKGTIALRSNIDQSCGQMRMLDVGIPEALFATTARDWQSVVARAVGDESHGNRTAGGRFAVVEGEEVMVGSFNLEEDADLSAFKRLPWKPFDIAPVGRSVLQHVEQLQPLFGPRSQKAADATRPPQGTKGPRAALREVMSVMERSFFVYLGAWESGLGNQWEEEASRKHVATATRGRRHPNGAQQQGWSVAYPRPSVQRSCRATVADHLLHQRYALEELYGSEAAVLRAVPSLPTTTATRNGSAVVTRQPTQSSTKKQAPRRSKSTSLFDDEATQTTREVTLADAMRFVHRAVVNRTSDAPLPLPTVSWVSDPETVPVNTLDLRVPLVIAAGAVPLFHPTVGTVDGVPLELHAKCDKCFPSAPRQALMAAQRLAGVSYTKKQSTAADRERAVPLVDWMRFQPQSYAMAQAALFTHARQHMTTKAMALNVLRFSVPRAMNVVLAASDPFLPGIHALAHGLCDVGVAVITMSTAVRDALERDVLLQAIYWRPPEETPCDIRYVTSGAMLKVAAPRADLIVAVVDDAKDGSSPSAFQHRLNVLRSASRLKKSRQVVLVYNGRSHRRVGGMSAWCEWAMCNATVFRTRRVGAPKMPTVSTLQLSVDGQTFKIKSDATAVDGFRTNTRASGAGPCALTSPDVAMQAEPARLTRKKKTGAKVNPLRSNAELAAGGERGGEGQVPKPPLSAPLVGFELSCLKMNLANLTARVLEEWFSQFPDVPEDGWNYSSFQLTKPRHCDDIEVQLAIDESDVVDACTKTKVMGVTKFHDFAFNVSGPVTLRARVFFMIRQRTGCRLRWEKHQEKASSPDMQPPPEVTTMILKECPTYLAALTGKKMLLRAVSSNLMERTEGA